MFWQPTNGDFAYITMDPPGWADVAFGLNEKGIAATMNAGSPNKNAVMGSYSNFLIRTAMEHARSLEDAVGLFEDHIASGKTFSATGSIIHFMDFNQNKMAKIQLASEEIDVTYGKPLGSDATYIGSANHFVDGFKSDADFFYESSFERYARLVELMEQEMDTFDLDGCWMVLSDTNGGESTSNTISRTSTAAGSGSTVFGTIFTEEGLHYALGTPHTYLGEYGSAQFVGFAELQEEANKSGSGGTCHVTSVGGATANSTGLLLLGLVGLAAMAMRRRKK
jgi:MYXO-CTERM domain-containing protein